jgi:hypothetical protein
LKRSSSATALAELAAAASKAAAAVPGGSNISRSLAAVAAAVGLPDAAAEAELEVVPTYDGEKADVYRCAVLLAGPVGVLVNCHMSPCRLGCWVWGEQRADQPG